MAAELLMPFRRVETRSNELAVMGTILTVEAPMYQALQAEYGQEKGWSVCGPASIVLSRMISRRNNIPIRQGGEGEHLELITRFHKRRPQKKDTDHTSILYHTGREAIFLIDPIYPITSEDKQPGRGTTKFEGYKKDEIDTVLAEKYSLYPFSHLEPEDAVWDQMIMYTRGTNLGEVYELETALNDDTMALGNSFRNEDGVTRMTPWWGDRVRRVLHAVEQAA